MLNRINLILKAKNITSKQFAEEIGVQPSGLSHILSGRNNPSLDFVMKVIRRYPEIDIHWLMFGKGEMYESQPIHLHPLPVDPQPEVEPDLFSQMELPEPKPEPKAEPKPEPKQEPAPEPAPEPTPTPAIYNNVEEPQEPLMPENPKIESVPATSPEMAIPARQKRIVKMIVLYDDKSFSEYYPE